MDPIYSGALVGFFIGGGAGVAASYGISKMISLDKDVVKGMGLTIGAGALGGAWVGGVYSCMFVGASALLRRISLVAYEALEKR
jgi:hypothetical protein